MIEGEVYVTGLRYHGTIHDLVMLNPIMDNPAARKIIATEDLYLFFLIL
jgi:hypothetical protein